MPTYQYRCQSCKDEFEVRQSFADEALTACPDTDCGGSVNKVFSGVGISFKGDGFYKNDHGSVARGRKADAGSTKKSESGSADTSSSNGSGSDPSGGSGDSSSSKDSGGTSSTNDSSGASSTNDSGDKATASAS